MEEYKNQHEVTVQELIAILQQMKPDAIVINGEEANIRIYSGRENRPDGKAIVMLC